MYMYVYTYKILNCQYYTVLMNTILQFKIQMKYYYVHTSKYTKPALQQMLLAVISVTKCKDLACLHRKRYVPCAEQGCARGDGGHTTTVLLVNVS